jgi:hypothetical protein
MHARRCLRSIRQESALALSKPEKLAGRYYVNLSYLGNVLAFSLGFGGNFGCVNIDSQFLGCLFTSLFRKCSGEGESLIVSVYFLEMNAIGTLTRRREMRFHVFCPSKETSNEKKLISERVFV